MGRDLECENIHCIYNTGLDIHLNNSGECIMPEYARICRDRRLNYVGAGLQSMFVTNMNVAELTNQGIINNICQICRNYKNGCKIEFPQKCGKICQYDKRYISYFQDKRNTKKDI